MELRVAAGAVDDAQALVVGVWYGEPPQGLGDLETEIRRLYDEGAFGAGRGEVQVLHTFGRHPARRLVLAGLGEPAGLRPDDVRRLAATVARRLRAERVTQAVFPLLGAPDLSPADAAQAVVEGVALSGYRFDRYRQPSNPPSADLQVLEVVGGSGTQAGVDTGRAVSAGVALARDLVNTPRLDMTPADIAQAAEALAAEHGCECTVFDQDELARRGFGLILGVNRGSGDEGCYLITLRYRGDGPALGLVGKGVAYDTGGLSIKPADGMMTMKGDMGGAAAVLGTLRAVAELRLPLDLTVVIPTALNLVGPNAIVPGDVLTGYAGKSVEVLNTDAEGRLLLADALAYAVGELHLTRVVDIATLTGACARALGPVYSGVFGTSRELVEGVREAGLNAGEKFWELPLDEEFAAQLKSPVADLKNIGTPPNGGAITAAMFLREFVGEAAWAHLDIAGKVIGEQDEHYLVKGATGYGVRTLVGLCRRLAG